MSRRQFRDLKRALLELAEPYGAAVEIETTGRTHYRAVITRGTYAVSIVSSSTPSDRRYMYKVLADARRKLRAFEVSA